MEIFLITAPGLESRLADEARERGYAVQNTLPGGVTITGDWDTVSNANYWLRGATRVLVRLAAFRALHLAQLDKRARKLPWADWFSPESALRVDVTCRRSRIYHHKAAAQRIERAVRDTIGVSIAPDAPLTLKVRIEDDLCTISVDTSGDPLHKRGLKTQLNKAPMRETLAALFLRDCGFDGTGPVYDPMCGSGTFPIEAAEIASGLAPGRARSFAHEALACAPKIPASSTQQTPTEALFFGSDRDTGAISMARANAERAGVSDLTMFMNCTISDITPPCDAPGLVIANPPYGGRIGNKAPLYGLYARFGEVLRERFRNWRVGIITSDRALAHATGLNFGTTGPIVDHGGIKVRLYQTGPLP